MIKHLNIMGYSDRILSATFVIELVGRKISCLEKIYLALF